jgi:16S rRNA (uracil1498-N3)-methyltransferase
VRLSDGAGKVAHGTIVSLSRDALVVQVDEVVGVPPPPPIHLRAPVADRDRMLWLAEKAAELGVSSWQAVRFLRSASVSPRGEGPAFAAKIRARMIAAVEQSGGAWLPAILPDAAPEELVVGPDELPVLLDSRGLPLSSVLRLPARATPVILLGPEGGLDKSESQRLQAGGWRLASLAATTLRFETAGIAAVAVCRALHMSPEG